MRAMFAAPCDACVTDPSPCRWPYGKPSFESRCAVRHGPAPAGSGFDRGTFTRERCRLQKGGPR